MKVYNNTDAPKTISTGETIPPHEFVNVPELDEKHPVMAALLKEKALTKGKPAKEILQSSAPGADTANHTAAIAAANDKVKELAAERDAYKSVVDAWNALEAAEDAIADPEKPTKQETESIASLSAALDEAREALPA